MIGFTGSAGTLVVCQGQAALWTDSRYWEQAEAELQGSGIDVMRAGAADVPAPSAWVAERLQVARELERHLEDEYPYRTRVPLGCGAGVAIWSRYPLESEQIDFPAPCQLQSVLVDLGERRVRVVNVHAQSHTSWRPRRVERNFALRREQIETILAYVEGRPEPLILMGDMNSAPMHEVIQLLTARLHDAFSDAGRGFGHTFPATSGRLRGVYYPSRLMRLDYVFHSDAWTAERAWLAEWDGYSDHLAVLARLRLRE